MFNRKSSKGFTLIELILVMAIIAILTTTIFAAFNPIKRFQDAKDSRRITDVDTILTSIHQYIVDNKGTLPAGLTTGMAEKQLGTGLAAVCSPLTTGGCTISAGTACVDLSTPLVKYLKALPIDPIGGSTYTAAKTGYSITVDLNNIITVKACGTEGATNISASR